MRASRAVICLLATPSLASPLSWSLNKITSYTPFEVACPKDGNIIRDAGGISEGEVQFLANRKPKAWSALKTWLEGLSAGFDTSNLPTIALSTSGGGYRATLAGGGVVYGFDGREKASNVSGLYQAFTYHSGLSGGAWLVASLSSHNFPPVGELSDNLWKKTFANSYFKPDPRDFDEYQIMDKAIDGKEDAGFDDTLTDVWGTLLAYQLLPGGRAATTTLSGLTALSSIQNGEAPYPIIVSLGVLTSAGQCLPKPNATVYEFHPYEIGSWDKGVHSFVDSRFLGSLPSAANTSKPKKNKKGKEILSELLPLSNVPPFTRCYNGFDNLGYILGTSSHLFNEYCYPLPRQDSFAGRLLEALPFFVKLLRPMHQSNSHDFYAAYPNPFYNHSGAPLVAHDKELMLVDGGEALQNNPIWPFIQPTRDVDVLIVNDNSADNLKTHLPDGTALHQTYVQAKLVGLTKMPYVPPPSEFIAGNLTKHALAFGCNEPETMTMVYLPNTPYIFPSGTGTTRMEYKPDETEGMIKNGGAVASQNGDEEWPLCLGCLLMKKRVVQLPEACGKCFEKYCYTQNV